jgi:hypothetical protein
MRRRAMLLLVDIEHIFTGIAAHGLQPLLHFFRDPHRLALAHPPNTLRHQRRFVPL